MRCHVFKLVATALLSYAFGYFMHRSQRCGAVPLPHLSTRSTLPLPTNCTLQDFGGNPSTGYGVWRLCNESLSWRTVVFAFGVGPDASFEAGLAEAFGSSVVSFDPTIDQNKYEAALHVPHARPLKPVQRSRLRFLNYGIGTVDGVLTFYSPGSASMTTVANLPGYSAVLKAPVFTMKTLLQLASVTRIDVLKLDVEGVEFELFEDVAFTRWLISADGPEQLAIEFHDRLLKRGANMSVSLHAYRRRLCFYAVMRRGGYSRRHISRSGEEILMVRTRASVLMPPQESERRSRRRDNLDDLAGLQHPAPGRCRATRRHGNRATRHH